MPAMWNATCQKCAICVIERVVLRVEDVNFGIPDLGFGNLDSFSPSLMADCGSTNGLSSWISCWSKVASLKIERFGW